VAHLFIELMFERVSGKRFESQARARQGTTHERGMNPGIAKAANLAVFDPAEGQVFTSNTDHR